MERIRTATALEVVPPPLPELLDDVGWELERKEQPDPVIATDGSLRAHAAV